MSEDNKTPELSTNDVQNQDNQQPVFQIPTEAAELVGDGKKYSSVEDALKSVPHAQKHIQTLESELAAAREELAKRKTAEELLDEIKSGIQPQATPAGSEFDQDKLLQLVDQTLEQKERQRAAKTNAESVANKFTEKFGDKAEEAFLTIAKEAGLTVQQLNSLAMNSPKVVLKLAGFGDSADKPPAHSSGSLNTQSLGNKPQELSARVPKGASTKDMVSAWKAAGEKVKQNLNT